MKFVDDDDDDDDDDDENTWHPVAFSVSFSEFMKLTMEASSAVLCADNEDDSRLLMLAVLLPLCCLVLVTVFPARRIQCAVVLYEVWLASGYVETY